MINWSDKILVKRTTEGSYELGEYVSGKPINIEIIGNVQPFFPNEHLRETSGRRNTEAIKIYSKDALYPKEKNQDADIITYNGRKYEVYQVRNYTYSNFMESHYKSIALLVDEAKQ